MAAIGDEGPIGLTTARLFDFECGSAINSEVPHYVIKTLYMSLHARSIFFLYKVLCGPYNVDVRHFFTMER